MRSSVLVAALTLVAQIAPAAEHASWAAYMQTNRYKCPGPFDTLKSPQTLELAGKKYKHTGYQLIVQNKDADANVKIGVLDAIKDVTQGTKNNLAEAIAWFKSEGVEWIVANGDLALEEFDLEEVVDILGSSGLPVLVVLGNSESVGSWARVYKERLEKYPNIINGTWVRQIIADDVEFWTLPGYYNKKFVHQGAGCLYKPEDVTALEKLTAAGDAPVVLVSHGPPLGKGKLALDWITDRINVGDPAMTTLIEKKKIPFGLFGHILEAGGTAVGRDMSTPVKAGTLVSDLYVNAGSASGDPFGLNDGSTSYGMAFLVSIEGGKAKYQVRRFKAAAEE